MSHLETAAEAANRFASSLLTMGIRFDSEVIARVGVPLRVLHAWQDDASLRMMNPRQVPYLTPTLKVVVAGQHAIEFFATNEKGEDLSRPKKNPSDDEILDGCMKALAEWNR